jgi:hypothetical protein
MEMELHSISFNDHKPLLLMYAGKANSLIKGQSLLRISHGEARSDCMKDWPARWCGFHVMLFLSRLQRKLARTPERIFRRKSCDGFSLELLIRAHINLTERLHHPIHRRMLAVLHLDPVFRPASLDTKGCADHLAMVAF